MYDLRFLVYYVHTTNQWRRLHEEYFKYRDSLKIVVGGRLLSRLAPIYLEIVVVNGNEIHISMRFMKFEFYSKRIRGKIVKFNISNSSNK